MSNALKRFLLVTCIVIILINLVGCGGKEENVQDTTKDTPTSEVSSAIEYVTPVPGEIPSDHETAKNSTEIKEISTPNIKNSTPIPKSYIVSGNELGNKITKEMAFSYLQKAHKKIFINCEEVAASVPLSRINTGKANLGILTRPLTPEEKALNLKETIFGYEAFAVIVNNNSKVKDLSIESVKKVMKGEIKNWSQLGGDDGKITLYMMGDTPKGNRMLLAVNDFFELIQKSANGKTNKSLMSTYIKKDSENEVIEAVSQQDNAIGIISFDSIDNASVYPIDIEGVEPSIENLLSGKYKMCIPFKILSKENIEPDMKEFVSYIIGEEGQKNIKAKGYYPINVEK
ncbi:substrate-binding domain-containing protein [Pseudobacteroides cellulosolvens]|uniref:PBP domain containing protein n=1 Tax=Pseudobacteroides cellulosolvens ATCC 35603 = DSM 2933 TaxID=398512 RepID=A0A0L6JQK9_9FIRM|nr:substrate-binding domain-containing protein [Pseudobacteroides cellulosolvens]KNY27652.1 PBP domain containing protein [Pseudobacteroides cellulosolvens ATCC 35603 = DSM 2933]